jgi:hypothetical protein
MQSPDLFAAIALINEFVPRIMISSVDYLHTVNALPAFFMWYINCAAATRSRTY